MKVVWLGIAIAFLCLTLASLLHFQQIRHKFWRDKGGRPIAKVSGVSTGFVELYALAKGMVFLEGLGFLIAFSAAMIDFFL